MSSLIFNREESGRSFDEASSGELVDRPCLWVGSSIEHAKDIMSDWDKNRGSIANKQSDQHDYEKKPPQGCEEKWRFELLKGLGLGSSDMRLLKIARGNDDM